MELLPLDAFSASNYRVSTMTVTGSVNATINLKKIFDLFDIDSFDSVKYIEYGVTKNEQDFKGEKSAKSAKNDKKKKVKKRFDNQMTLHMYDNLFKYNVKLFKNGNVQMTGVKDVECGKAIIDELIKIIKITNKLCEEHDIVEIEDLFNCKYNTRLINCDFKVSYKVNRSILHKLVNTKNNLTCSYEPCIYQGVKISFYMNDYSLDGICRCPKKCLGKGPKTICKKITIAVFQSGCVTITGSTTIQQLEFVYKYMLNLLETHMLEIYQQTYKLSCI